MSLDTYAGIRAAIVEWAFTTGNITDAMVKNDFFPQLWSMIYYGDQTPGMMPVEPLRIRSMIESATLTTATGGTISISGDVSEDWLEFVELTPTLQGARSLNFLQPWEFRKQYDMLQNRVPPPVIYTIEGDTLSVAPKAAEADIAAVWYQGFTRLSADSDTDWLVENAPHVYLRGGLMLAADYLKDDGERTKYRADFAGAIRALNQNDKRQRVSGAVPVARPRSVA